ncbi:hypothetical protein GCM10020219_004020 [Nonomuraea dietziae]
MAGAPRDAVPRQRDVDGLLDQDAGVALGLQLGLARGERLVDRLAGAADALARLGAGRGRQGADLTVGQRDRRTVSGVREADLLECVEIARRLDRGDGVGLHARQLVGVQWGDLDGVVVRQERAPYPGLERTRV